MGCMVEVRGVGTQPLSAIRMAKACIAQTLALQTGLGTSEQCPGLPTIRVGVCPLPGQGAAHYQGRVGIWTGMEPTPLAIRATCTAVRALRAPAQQCRLIHIAGSGYPHCRYSSCQCHQSHRGKGTEATGSWVCVRKGMPPPCTAASRKLVPALNQFSFTYLKVPTLVN